MSLQLTQAEAEALIEMLKKMAKKGRLIFPSPGGRLIFEAVGVENGDSFDVSISRSVIAEKCTYQGRDKGSSSILLRLDLNPTNKHFNPDGELICGSHLHIYQEGYGDKFATRFDPDSPDLLAVCLQFFGRFSLLHEGCMSYQYDLWEGDSVVDT